MLMICAENIIGQNSSISEELIHCTVKINCTYSDPVNPKELTAGSGTAFFFDFRVPGDSTKTIPVIVTNKHVVRNSIKGTFVLTKMDSLGNPLFGETWKVDINNFMQKWIPHPDNNVDLCIMPIADLLRDAQNKNMPFYHRRLNEELIPSESDIKSFTAIEEVYMIGYPTGLSDTYNNIPITRIGQTATPLEFNYMGRKEFLIDMPVFPGSSGSPVLIFNEGAYTTLRGITMGTRIKLVGILHSGSMFDAKGQGKIVIDNIPVNVHTKTGIPIDIGHAIKAERLLEFKEILMKESTRKN